MAHLVLCPYCQERFDRDTNEYVKYNSRRYAHAACALREYEKNPTGNPPQVIDPLEFVQCAYCKEVMSKKAADAVTTDLGKIAHKKCAELEAKRELTEQEKLDKYILKLFQVEYVPPRIKKQIHQYVNQYNYTYSGIAKALQYFYEIKKNPIEKANGTIAIVPYIYQDAYRYFYALWEAQQKNTESMKRMDVITPQIIEIRIKKPERKINKRKLFSFLDEEENN